MSISGKTISVSIYNNLKKDLVKIKNNNITPGLAILLVGNNPSSIVYTKMKEKKCKELGN